MNDIMCFLCAQLFFRAKALVVLYNGNIENCLDVLIIQDDWFWCGGVTMGYLDSIGMESSVNSYDREVEICEHIINNGKSLLGYYGTYVYEQFGTVEIILHIGSDETGRHGEVIGITSCIKNNNVWNLIIEKDITEEDDELSKLLLCSNEFLYYGPIAIRLNFADVLPSFCVGDRISVQTAAYPSKINYYVDEESCTDASGMTLMGEKLSFKMGSVFNVGDGEENLLMATVKSVNVLKANDIYGNEFPFLEVTVDTDFGDLCVYHSLEMVTEEERSFIKPGCCMFASCGVDGNVAVNEYANGAIWDKEHCLMVLGDCFERYDFMRTKFLFANDAKYIGMDGTVRAQTGKECREFLQLVSDTRGKMGNALNVYLAKTICKADNSTDLALVISYEERPAFLALVFVGQNERKQINEIRVANPVGYEVEIKDLVSAEINKSSCLNYIKRVLDTGDIMPLINLLAYDAKYTDGEEIIDYYWYDTLFRFQGMVDLIEQHGMSLNVYNIQVLEDSPRGLFHKGDEGLALSLGGIDVYDGLVFIDFSNGKIDTVEVLQEGDVKVQVINSNKI